MLLNTTILIVLMTTGQVLEGLPAQLRASYLDDFARHLIFADAANTQADVLGCCGSNKTLGFDAMTSEFRLEHTFPRALQRSPRSDWYVFTDGDTWWHRESLAAELARVQDVVAPATPGTDVLLVGGGGLLTFSQFMILSRPALEFLSTRSVIDECRAHLFACQPLAPHSGCR